MSTPVSWCSVVYVTPELLADPSALETAMRRTEAPDGALGAIVTEFRVSDSDPPCRHGFTRMLVLGTATVAGDYKWKTVPISDVGGAVPRGIINAH